MRKILYIFSCSMLLAVSCGDTEKAPIPREQMVGMITDIHLAEVYSTMVNDSLHRTVNRNVDSLAYYYKSILNHYGVSMQQFKEALDWYSSRPEQLDTAYIKALENLSTMEGIINAAPGAASPE